MESALRSCPLAVTQPPASSHPPEPDEIEVTLLGRGIGECCLVHLGNDVWMIVDSFYRPRQRVSTATPQDRIEHDHVPAASVYLDDLYVGTDRVANVALIVLTHFHQDHYEGIFELHERYEHAILAVPNATTAATFPLVFSEKSNDSLRLVGQAIQDARRRRFGKKKLRKSPKYVVAGLRVFNLPGVEVHALAPQHAAVSAMNKILASLLAGQVDAPKLENALNNENRTSIALHVRACGASVLLGGDVEEAPRDLGWMAVVDDDIHDDLPKTSIVKVPHHGSDNADHPPMWDKFVEEGSPMLVAPFWSSSRPRQEDQERLQERGKLWQSATSTSTATSDWQVVISQDAETGGVQARRQSGSEWTLGVFGPGHLTNP